MSEVRDVLQENRLLRYGFMILGLILTTVGVNGFLRPAHLLSGGITGASVIINYLTNINIGLLTFLINIPIFILGFMYLKREFCITSMINMIIFSLLLGVTQDIHKYIPVNNLLLQSIYGGILSGAGLGVVFRAKASQGGTDIISAILKVNKNIEMRTTALAINVIIVLLGGALFGLNLALYTLMGMFLNAYTMSFVKDALNYQKSVMVISSKNEKIAKEIMETLVRGVTYLNAEGAYTEKPKKIIYTVVSSSEIPKIKNIVFKYDKGAFISVNDVSEVKGRGFKPKDL